VGEGAGVRLRRSGSHRWQGACPFHDDRTPSFFVDVQTERFVCFGCKVRGDVIEFVRMREQLSTVGETCASLTRSPPPVIGRRRPRDEPRQSDRRWDRLTLEQQLVLNAAGALYRDALWRNPQARAYLAERGLPDWVVRTVVSATPMGVPLRPTCASMAGCGSPRTLVCCDDPSQAKEDACCGNASPGG